jgi:hypothetical protein
MLALTSERSHEPGKSIFLRRTLRTIHRALQWSLRSLIDQGGIAIELIDDGNETIDITADIAAIHIGR